VDWGASAGVACGVGTGVGGGVGGDVGKGGGGLGRPIFTGEPAAAMAA